MQQCYASTATQTSVPDAESLARGAHPDVVAVMGRSDQASMLHAILLLVTSLAPKGHSPDWVILEEAKVILAFHLVGTAMELFKTHMGSWEYPEPSLLRIGGVPLFSGFMYAAVGSSKVKHLSGHQCQIIRAELISSFLLLFLEHVISITY